MATGDSGGTLTALGKTFRIVEYMTETDGSVRITELATELDISKSTVYKHLNTLRSEGYVDKRDVEYRLSPRFIDVGEHVKDAFEPYAQAKPAIDSLAETTDETAGLVLEHDRQAVDIYSAVGSHPDACSMTTTRHLHCSAPGKAILATLPDDAVAEILDGPLPSLTPDTITDRGRLRSELRRIGERGIAFARGEQRPDVNSVAVPVAFEEYQGAVYVAGTASRLSSKRLEEDVPGMVLSTVREIEAAIA